LFSNIHFDLQSRGRQIVGLNFCCPKCLVPYWTSVFPSDEPILRFLVTNSHQKVAYVTRKQAVSRGEPPLSIFSPRITMISGGGGRVSNPRKSKIMTRIRSKKRMLTTGATGADCPTRVGTLPAHWAPAVAGPRRLSNNIARAAMISHCTAGMWEGFWNFTGRWEMNEIAVSPLSQHDLSPAETLMSTFTFQVSAVQLLAWTHQCSISPPRECECIHALFPLSAFTPARARRRGSRGLRSAF